MNNPPQMTLQEHKTQVMFQTIAAQRDNALNEVVNLQGAVAELSAVLDTAKDRFLRLKNNFENKGDLVEEMKALEEVFSIQKPDESNQTDKPGLTVIK